MAWTCGLRAHSGCFSRSSLVHQGPFRYSMQQLHLSSSNPYVWQGCGLIRVFGARASIGGGGVLPHEHSYTSIRTHHIITAPKQVRKHVHGNETSRIPTARTHHPCGPFRRKVEPRVAQQRQHTEPGKSIAMTVPSNGKAASPTLHCSVVGRPQSPWSCPVVRPYGPLPRYGQDTAKWLACSAPEYILAKSAKDTEGAS